MTRPRWSPLSALLLASACGIACVATTALPAQEPSARSADSQVVVSFTLSGPADAGAALPDDVERALRDDEYLFDCFHDAQTGLIAFAPEWFAVARRDLDGDGHRDWIVWSDEECLRRGGAGLWWLYQEVPQDEEAPASRRLLLRTHATGLDLLAERRWAFPDIFVPGDTATHRRFRYDGEAYVEASVLEASQTDSFAYLLGPFYGEWEPLSRVYFGHGAMALRPRRLSWSETCRDAAYRVLEAEVGNAVIELDDAADCRFDDTQYSVLELTLQENDCRLEVSLYDSAQAARGGARSSWGFLFKPDCNPNPEE